MCISMKDASEADLVALAGQFSRGEQGRGVPEGPTDVPEAEDRAAAARASAPAGRDG